MERSEDTCGCPPSGDEDAAPFCCNQKAYPFSEEEEAIHARLLAIKREVREAKERSGEDEAAARTGKERLEALRAEWDALKKQGEEAARRRMIALGHVD